MTCFARSDTKSLQYKCRTDGRTEWPV